MRTGKLEQEPFELTRVGERRCPAAEEHRVHLVRQHAPLELQLGEESIDVCRVLTLPPDHRDEVAVAAPMRAEREVHVEVPDVSHG